MSDELNRVLEAIGAIELADNEPARVKAIKDAKATAEGVIDTLEGTIDEYADRIESLKGEAEGKTGEVADAVNRLLDEIERPVGTLSFDVPKSAPVDRALIGLHDAVGRRL